MSPPPLRVGYVPEHFSTPLHFAQRYFGLEIEAVAFPSGTGHMITALQTQKIDIAIGLTEAWVSGLGKAASNPISTSISTTTTDTNAKNESKSERARAGYQLVGSYVQTPLCWAIAVRGEGGKGGEAEEKGVDGIGDAEGLRGGRMGVSRTGSGSYVMGFVLADQRGWLSDDNNNNNDTNGNAGRGAPYSKIVPLQTFAELRKGVNDGVVDFFMWEHFTTKRYFDNGEVKRIGEIYTPWPSWAIVATPEVVREGVRLEDFIEKLNCGIGYFNGHKDEAVEYISSELDYSQEDAREWLKTVRFVDDVRGVKRGMVDGVVETLKKASVLGEEVGEDAVEKMAAFWRS